MLKTLAAITVSTAALLAAAPAAWAAASVPEIAAFQTTGVSAHDAVKTAEKAGEGKAMDVAFKISDGAPTYDITILKGGATSHYAINAKMDPAVAHHKTGIMSKFEGEGKGEKASAQAAKVSMIDALRNAEKDSGGKSIAAEFEIHGATAGYDIEIVKDGKSVMLTVDAGTGNVMPTSK